MKLFSRLTPSDYERPRNKAGEFIPPPPEAFKPPSATTIGALVVMLTRSHTSYQARKGTLEEEIATRTEELRQVNASLSSLAAALMVASEDPVLTEDERSAAEQAGEARLDAALGAVDLTEGAGR